MIKIRGPRKTIEEKLWSKVEKAGPNECWRWTGSMLNGTEYGVLLVGPKTDKHVVRAHRVAYELENGPIGAGVIIRHLCSNAWCVNPRHLRAGTQADNIRDKVVAGRQARGSRHGRSKLTEDDVREILRRPHARITDLAETYGVHRRLISLIRAGSIWKHVQARPEQTSLLEKVSP